MSHYCRRLGRLPSRSCAKFVGSSLRAHLFVKEGARQAFHSRSSANLHFVLPQPFSRYFCLLGPPNRCRFYAARRRRSNNHKHRHCGIATPLFLWPGNALPYPAVHKAHKAPASWRRRIRLRYQTRAVNATALFDTPKRRTVSTAPRHSKSSKSNVRAAIFHERTPEKDLQIG